MEPLVTHAAKAADMLGVDRSGIFRLIAAKLLETIKIRLAAHNGRVHPPRRSPERGGRSS